MFINVDYVVLEEKVKFVLYLIFGFFFCECEVVELLFCGWLKDGCDFDVYMSYFFDNGILMLVRMLGYVNFDDDEDISIVGFEEI